MDDKPQKCAKLVHEKLNEKYKTHSRISKGSTPQKPGPGGSSLISFSFTLIKENAQIQPLHHLLHREGEILLLMIFSTIQNVLVHPFDFFDGCMIIERLFPSLRFRESRFLLLMGTFIGLGLPAAS